MILNKTQLSGFQRSDRLDFRFKKDLKTKTRTFFRKTVSIKPARSVKEIVRKKLRSSTWLFMKKYYTHLLGDSKGETKNIFVQQYV